MKNIYRTLQLLFIGHRLFKRRLKTEIRGQYCREALEKMGPIFVKFGQLLSTRPDIFPPDVLKELKKLQDNVPPFSGAIAKRMVEVSFKQPVTELFQDFDLTPLAAASIAQVHPAILNNGDKVVVKILRPHIHQQVKQDLELLHFLAKWAEIVWPTAKKFKVRLLVAEFKKILTEELDLTREAANGSQLKRNFSHSPLLYVPKIYWPMVKNTVLVMERVDGIPLSNLQLIHQQAFDHKKLAETLLEIFFTQVFTHRFFHADMHPGNLLLSENSVKQPAYIAVDFGIMGTLTKADQYYLTENLQAFLKRDYHRVAELHAASGWVSKKTRLDDFEAAIRTVSEPILEQSLTKISFGALLLKLFQTAMQYDIDIQPQLLLFQKTLLNVEGLSRELYPEIDLLATLKPLLETWVKDQLSVSTLIQKLKANAPLWLEKIAERSF